MTTETNFDVLIVGAGFAGCVVARELAEAGRKVQIVEKRPHIAGNAYDSVDAHGHLIHDYGPHIFHTNSEMVIRWLSQFTRWRFYEHRVLAKVGEQLLPIPINRQTLNKLYGLELDEAGAADYLAKVREPRESNKTSEDVVLSSVGQDLCDKFFRGYTQKQWGLDLSELSAGVAARIPTRTNDDDRYFTDTYQLMPDKGYTAMLENILESTPGIELHLGMDFTEARARWNYKHLVFTGPIDEFFDRCHGPLAYRSLRFEHESFDASQLLEREAISGKPGFWQPAMQVNYPDAEVPFTRIVEIKHATGQVTPNSTIVREFPKDWTPGEEPYYPVPAADARLVYQKYTRMAEAEASTSFIGRLATYRYYNMDQVTAMALNEADKLLS
jgi:UDP-galactopyranose mutase